MKIKTREEFLKDNLLVKHVAGSHAYGMCVLTSDKDYRGIFYADPVNVRTPFFPIHETEDSEEEDTKFHELTHYMKLCLQCNPNIVETLWVQDEDIIFRTPAYDLLRAYRREFLSSKIAFTFSGYATAQLKRLSHSKKQVNYLPSLNSLCKLLRKALTDNLINEEFIANNCGNHVLEFVINTPEQLGSINEHTTDRGCCTENTHP